MEITEINMISDFEAGLKCLQNPSLISRFLQLPGVQKVPHVDTFWKWGALILAIFATLSSIINRMKVLFIRVREIKPPVDCSLRPILVSDFDFTEDYESSSSEASSDNDDEDFESTTSFEDQDFRVAGSSCYGKDERQNGNLKFLRVDAAGQDFSWSDFTTGKSVVKLWDNIGLGFDYLEDSFLTEISIWDLNKSHKISSFCGGTNKISAVTMSSPGIVLSTNNVAWGTYDARVGRHNPAICASWKPQGEKFLSMGTGGVEKFYVRDGNSGEITIYDLRNVKGPLEKLSEWDYDTC